MPQVRQLAAIMFTDIVGYTALMGYDEQKAFELIKINREVQKPIIESFGGKWIKEMGDGVLASFNTVIEAVECAIAIQQSVKNIPGLRLRIGIHLGDVVFENDDVFGDGVNIAARIQAITAAGSVWISEPVYNNVANKKNIQTKFVQVATLKNVREPVRIYEVTSRPEQSDEKGNDIQEQDNVQPAAGQQYEPPSSNTNNGTPYEKSVAVLPFVNMSSDPDQDYFGDGVAEEIISSLTHIRNLKVAGRTSSSQFKSAKIDIREVGKILRVSHVLEGSVRKQGNLLRVTAQLINVADGFHLWSEKFDGSLDDIFAIQDKIAVAIASKLKITLFENDLEQIKKLYTHNTKAYQFYLQGRYYWKRRSKEGLQSAIRFFEKALLEDPDYALALTGIADSYKLIGEFTNVNRKDLYQKQKTAITRALEIDPLLAEAHISNAMSLMLSEWDWKNSEKEFKTGIALNPNYATGRHWYAEWLFYNGNFEKGYHEISMAVELDPVSQGILKDKGMHLYYNTNYDEAIEIALNTLDLDPGFVPVYRLLSLCYVGKQQFDKAIEFNEKWGTFMRKNIKTTVSLAHIYASAGRKDEAENLIKDVKPAELGSNDYRGMALVYTALGNKTKAFDWLEKSIEMHEESLCSLKVDPKFAAIRNDDRFKDMVKKVGL